MKLSNIACSVMGILALTACSPEESKAYTTTEKTQLCQAYIGQLFQKPINIIKFDKEDSKGLTYVSYTRQIDNTKWSYVCDIDSKNKTMTWAGWFQDTGNWGRWRSEDTVSLNYDKETNSTTFKVVNTGNLVKVSFN